jgi:ketosteroid isomerase-like protein
MPASALRLAFTAVLRLPPGSNLRRRLVKRSTVRSLDASGRGAFDFGLLFYEPDVEVHVLGDVARALGLSESYRGHQGLREVWRDYQRGMDELRLEPEEIIDLGDRIALRVTLAGTGRASGATTRHTEAFVMYYSPRGLIARHEIYWSWQDALVALSASDSAARHL